MASIELSTGKKSLEIIRDGESAGVIWFSPADPALLSRMTEAEKRFKAFDVGITKEMDTEAALAKAKEADAEFRGIIDYIFDYPCSDIIVGNSFSFTSADGASIMEQFFDGVIPFIKSEIDKETAAVNARRGKYLDKYKK